MRIDHGDAIELEGIVRKVFSYDRAGIGGYINADHSELASSGAVLTTLVPLWERADFHETKDFLFKWEESLRNGNGRNISIVSCINELENLATTLVQR